MDSKLLAAVYNQQELRAYVETLVDTQIESLAKAEVKYSLLGVGDILSSTPIKLKSWQSIDLQIDRVGVITVIIGSNPSNPMDKKAAKEYLKAFIPANAMGVTMDYWKTTTEEVAGNE